MARKDDFEMPVVGRLQVKLLLEALRPHVHGVFDLADMLGEALLALDNAGRKRFVEMYETSTGKAFLRALESVTEEVSIDDEKTPVAIQAAWSSVWKLWDKIIKATNRENGPYMQNTISYSTPDLDIEGLVHDLDDAAERLRRLIGPFLAANVSPKFDLLDRVTRSLATIAQDVDWAIRPEEVVPLGPKLTQVLLDWIRLRSEQLGTEGERREAVESFEEELAEEAGFELDPATRKAFFASKTKGAKKRSSKTKNRESSQ